MMKRKAPSTAFKKGEAGNPGGRPKTVTEVRELAKQYTVGAIETLASLMFDEGHPPGPRVAAANSLLDRGHGKAPQTFEPTNLDALTDAELEKRLRESLAEIRAIGWGHLLDKEPEEPGRKKASTRPH